MRRRMNWTEKKKIKLKHVQDILEELSEYKPLTLRQVYYQLVGKGIIENTTSQYVMLSKLIKWARIDGHINWEDIEDRIRNFNDLTGYLNKQHFVDNQMYWFLEGYKRNLLQSQDVYIEIWIEKDALSSLFIKFADPYRVPVVVCRGFSSVSFLNDFKKRLNDNSDKNSVMLYFGDFDPSGIEMLDSMEITLRDELGIDGIKFKRISLCYDDIQKYNLPHDPSALKKTDTRANKHVSKYGEIAVELDAMSPGVLKRKIVSAIKKEINMKLFEEEKKKEGLDIGKIQILKNEIESIVSE